MISGKVNVLLKQPAVGPWEALQAGVGGARGREDITVVLNAVKATRCFADTLEVEALAQVQVQELGEPQQDVWTVDFEDESLLSPQDMGRWVWTPVSCICDEANREFMQEMWPWIAEGLEQPMPTENSDAEDQ